MGTGLQRGPNNRTEQAEKKMTGYATFRTCRSHKDERGSQNVFEVEHVKRKRREDQTLRSLHGIREEFKLPKTKKNEFGKLLTLMKHG